MSQKASRQDSSSGTVDTQDWLILLLLSVVWGSSYILIKKGLIAFKPEEMALLRIEITGLAFIPIFFLLAKGRVPRKKIPWVAATGLFGSGLPAFLFAFAQTHVASSVAGMLNSLTPIFTWGMGLIFFSLGYSRNQLVGVMIGLIGAVFIIALEPNFTFNIHPYTLLVVLAAISYAISGNIVKTHLQNIEPITLSSIAFLFVGLPVVAASFFTDVYTKIETEPQALWSLGAIALLSLVGTVMANILFYRLIQRTNAVYASSVSYLIPIMALIWGVLDGEALQWTHIAGMVFILLGVWVLRRK